MYIDAQTIITASSLLAAVVAIFSAIFGVYRWYLKQNKQDEQEIWDAENNLLCEELEDDEGWGEDDIYSPNK